MIPRGPAPRTAAATSSAECGTTIRARVGAVRPQPHKLVVLDIALKVTREESTGRQVGGRRSQPPHVSTSRPDWRPYRDM